jgi:hypothetical protein
VAAARQIVLFGARGTRTCLPRREALMSQCGIWGFDRDSQYLNGISGAPFLLLVLGMKRLSCFGAWMAAD